ALGIEALSRGAAGACFVEPDALAARALRDNLARLKVVGGEVAAVDAQAFLRSAARAFDLVFLDPPFALDLWSALAGRLEQGGWLAARAWIYVESPREAIPAVPANWTLHRGGRASASTSASRWRGWHWPTCATWRCAASTACWPISWPRSAPA